MHPLRGRTGVNDQRTVLAPSGCLLDAPIALIAAGQHHPGALALVVARAGTLAAPPEEWLSADEVALLPAPRYGRRRHELAAGRLAAKRALAHLLPAADLRAISILPGVMGQPVVSGAGVANVGVSLSHSGDAAVAVAFPEACPLGVDIESFVEDCEPVLSRHARAAERSLMRAAGIGSDIQGLTALWCAKEALAKLLLCGLAAHGTALGVAEVRREGARLLLDFDSFAGYRAFVTMGVRRCFAVALPPRVAWSSATIDWLASPAAWLDASSEAASGADGGDPSDSGSALVT